MTIVERSGTGDPMDPTTVIHPSRPTHPRARRRWFALGLTVVVATGAGIGVRFAGATGSTASAFVPVTPVRILDTRAGVDVGLSGPFTSPQGRDLTVTGSIATASGPQVVVPAGATAIALNVTVVGATADGFVSVRPSGTPGPAETSNLNFSAGDIVPNAVTVALPTSGALAGSIELTYDAYGLVGPTADILGDVVGYFVEAPAGQQGPAGPTGPAGPAGATGPQGEPGTPAPTGLLPVAMGNVLQQPDCGLPIPRWNVLSCERTATGVYELELAGIAGNEFNQARYVTVVSPTCNDVTVAVGQFSSPTNTALLQVRLRSSVNQDAINCQFNFITWKTPT
jgi:hypothetical protein